MKEKLYEWINKNYRRNAQPLYAWVDVADLLSFIKTLDSPTPPTQEKEKCLMPEGTCPYTHEKPTQDTESWMKEFWEVEKKFNLSLDNENYDDLQEFAESYQKKGAEVAVNYIRLNDDVSKLTEREFERYLELLEEAKKV